MSKGKKVIPLVKLPEEVKVESVIHFEFPEGDPRNGMSAEEIQRLAKQEELEINNMLAKAPPLHQIASGGVEEEDDDEEDEDFKIDLKNGVVTQDLGSGLIVGRGNDKEKLIELSGNVQFNNQPVAVVTPDMEYTKQMTDLLVIQALLWIRKRMDADYKALDDLRWNSTTPSLKRGLENELESLEEQQRDLRKAMPPEGFNSRSVKYENIPEWAQPQIRRYVQGAFSQIISLIDESRI